MQLRLRKMLFVLRNPILYSMSYQVLCFGKMTDTKITGRDEIALSIEIHNDDKRINICLCFKKCIISWNK